MNVYSPNYIYVMNKVATTVKIDRDLYDDFKINAVKPRMTLQSLVEKCIYRYVREPLFRGELNAYILPLLSSSGSFTV
jgi:hypothetical protein